MNKQQSNQMASLRKKLLAALAMLLVACIMTVSSTYAWFTLSTAPEVKGISTNIGANGNLEMALADRQNILEDTYPRSYEGSSMANGDIGASNLTWGNLVDLGYTNNTYGLDKITLYPTRLNSDSGNLINRTNPLKFPKYGPDGRVSELSATTLTGAYNVNSQGFEYDSANEAYGVSGIGSASSMSQREFALMNAKADMESYRIAAQNAAKDAIREQAGTLASIALKYDNLDASAAVSAEDVAVLKALIANLYKANNNISESMKSAVLAILAGNSNLDDDKWATGASLANGRDIVAFIDILGQTAGTQGVNISTILTNVADLVQKYEDIDAVLDAASSALPADDATEQSTTWGAIETSVRALLNASGIKIGGYTVSEVKSDYKTNGMGGDVIKDLFNKMNNGLTYTFTSDSGIFADIAELAGEYTSSMAFPADTVVEGFDLNMLGSKPVEVESVAGETGMLGAAYTSMIYPLDPPDADPNAVKPLTDTYGYIVDLLFRTNATESDLLLQEDGTGRIYGEYGIAETQGNGSNMTFTVTAEYTKEKIEALAAGIRVVFFDGTDKILAVATLANGVLSGDAYKMELQLMNFTINGEGVITFTGEQADNKICALEANVKKQVSALVYLDGDVIDNADAGMVAELAAVLNLQFASSAKLTPMENADLRGE